MLRVAARADVPQIAALMRTSVLELFPKFYDARQTASAAVHIAALDPSLVKDGTYYVYDAGGEIVACGGWSRRAKLFSGRGARQDDKRLLNPVTEAARVRAMFVRGDWTRRGLGRAILEASTAAAAAEGFGTLILMATLPGVPLYRAFGFRERDRVVITMPDGVQLDGVLMDRPV
ncbi:MAG: GNAT family N-acetyltransferase [Thermocrispum sp.]